jgi:Starch-binding associating with outer membrane
MPMKRRHLALLAGAAILASACNMDKFLDVNTNPNAPQSVAAILYLPPMEHWMVTAPLFDGRFVARYTQQLMLPTTASVPTTWDRMGYDAASDNGGEQWRDVYWSLGQNLSDMLAKATAEQRWDLVGVGQVLRAWGWQVLVDLHGPIIIKEAFDRTRSTFDYDSEQYAYQVVDSLLHEAVKNLNRTDGLVDATYLGKGDNLYGGDRAKWLKFAYGLLAINHNHYSNKSTYDPATVIKYVDSSFTSNADDALWTWPQKDPTLQDYNFLGQSRNNFTNYRQTIFVLNLLNGTDFGGVVDPRLTRMLSPSPDGQYRGENPNNPAGGAFDTVTAPNNLFGKPGGQRPIPNSGRYVFDDKAKVPVMTYAQLQFIKAEAAYRSGDKVTALAAYRNGISSHIDFVNARVAENGDTAEHQITATEKANFLANPAIVPPAANLTLSQIMSQKYIAQWGWGHNELWMDMRRYHYTDIDPASGQEVFIGFTPPTNLFPDNGGKLVYRIRPRYNSEYVWNQVGLQPIGGLDPAYHTVPLWIIQP